MVIVFNPPEGKPISEKFKDSNGISLAKPLLPNSTQYCDPTFAEALVNNYPFLEILTAEQVESLKKEEKTPEPVKEEVKEEILPDIPIAETVKAKAKKEEKIEEIPDDLKGVDWYGEGVKEEHE